MSSTPDQVECEVCGQRFDPDESGGYCTNPDCGEWQYTSDDGDDGSAGSSDDMIQCDGCGEMVPDRQFCINCGVDFDETDDDEDEAEDRVDDDEDEAEDQVESPDPTCPSCDADVDPDWAACPQCGEDLTDGTPETEPIDPTPDEVVVEVGDVDIRAGDGETVGRKVRSAYVRTGADEEDAQYIHREHVKFEREDGSFYVVNKGRNGTKLNGEDLDLDERREVTTGDTVEFSDRAEGNIRLE